MANNKVQLGDGTVLIDLTGDTVTAATLSSGITAHDASGQQITGTAMTCSFSADGMFQYPSTVVVPNTVTALNGGTTSENRAGFTRHSEIEHVIFQEGCTINRIPNNTFAYCDGLLDMDIPSSVTFIGEYAFLACFSLTEFVLPSTVTSLGGRGWSNCTGLKKFVFNSIPSCSYYDSSSTMNLFYNCTALEDLQIPSGWTESLNLGVTSALTHDCLVAIIENLYDYSGSTKKHYLELTSSCLAKLSEEEIAVATAKNWTVS